MPPPGLLPYALLALGIVVLDQSTKLHSEKAFLEWWDPGEVMAYHRASSPLLSLGSSPARVRELQPLPVAAGSAPERVGTANWFDLRLSYLRNPGAAWGSFRKAQIGTRIPFFALISTALLGLFAWLFFRTDPAEKLARTALCLLVAGAAGNLVDRLVLRYVIDWIALHWRVFGWEYAFPLFNVADIAVSVGACALILAGFLPRPDPKLPESTA